MLGLSTVTVETVVMLALPSGNHPLSFGQSFAERFGRGTGNGGYDPGWARSTSDSGCAQGVGRALPRA